MNDSIYNFYNNPMLVIIMSVAVGGVFSVMSIVQFAKTAILDAYPDKKEEEIKNYFLTRNGKKAMTVIAALIYTIVVWIFGGLSDERLEAMNIIVRYLVLWVALSIISMGSYDLWIKKIGSSSGGAPFINAGDIVTPAVVVNDTATKKSIEEKSITAADKDTIEHSIMDSIKNGKQ